MDDARVQVSTIGYPHLPSAEICRSVDEVYRRFYFRPRKMVSLGAAMLPDRDLMRRRLAEGRDFLRFLRTHRARARSVSSQQAAKQRQVARLPSCPAAPV